MLSDVKTNLVAGLTDDFGIAPLTLKKLVKDFVADALLSIPVSLAAIGITATPSDKAALLAVTVAIGMAVVGAGYRALLRWATSA